jgi:proline dehydrogenase
MNMLNKLIVASIPAVPRPIVRRFASSYIAGEEIGDAVRVVKKLNSEGILATLDVLGEDISQREEAFAARDKILQVLETIAKEKLDSNVSIKLTQLGLKLDPSLCFDNTRSILSKAKELGNFVRIDMEDSGATDATLDIYRRIRKEFKNSGIVLQAYLHRTEKDASELIKEGLGHFRLCKGIYIEPAAIAFKEHDEVNNNFLKVLGQMLKQKAAVGIATHDTALIEGSYRLIKDMKLSRTEYEFQMLLGVRPELRTKLIRDGHRLRIYVPFGRQWYPYCIRRFKENPKIAGYVVKALFKKIYGN